MSNYPELPWIAEARKHIGLKEDTSKFKHSPTILKWLKVLGACGWIWGALDSNTKDTIKLTEKVTNIELVLRNLGEP